MMLGVVGDFLFKYTLTKLGLSGDVKKAQKDKRMPSSQAAVSYRKASWQSAIGDNRIMAITLL